MSEAPATRSNLTLRLLTAGVTAPLIIYLLFAGPHWAFVALTALVCVLGAQELFVMVAPTHRWIRGWGIAASAGMFALVAGALDPSWSIPAILLLACGGMLVSLPQIEPMENAALRMGWAIAGPVYLGALFGLIARLFQERHGGEWVVLSMLFGFWSDTGGYFAGRAYGKHKLYEAVSPKKTLEGSIGGLGGALLGGLIAHFWFLPSLSLLHAILLAIVAAAAGQAGDLCESVIKRSTGVKDSGTILPGHGGILDRVDALLFSTVVVWGYVQLIR
ncbi:MAG TPA: phosphatidate cytidylyltransferase [Polyangiales bacterium]